MNFKTFEYRRKDIVKLSKDSTIRLLFIVLMGAVLVWQIYLLALSYRQYSLNTAKLISVCFVAFICVVTIIYSIIMIARNLRITNVINAKGRCASSVNMVFDPSKTGFLNLYSIASKIIAIFSVVVLVSSLTTLILQVNASYSISFFLPFLTSICLLSLYSVHHINNEIRIAKSVDEFNRMY